MGIWETEFNLYLLVSNISDFVADIALISISCIEPDCEQLIKVPIENLEFFAVALIVILSITARKQVIVVLLRSFCNYYRVWNPFWFGLGLLNLEPSPLRSCKALAIRTKNKVKPRGTCCTKGKWLQLIHALITPLLNCIQVAVFTSGEFPIYFIIAWIRSKWLLIWIKEKCFWW